MVAALAAASVAFLHGGNLVVVDLRTDVRRVVMRHAGAGPVVWSGDGKLVSSGGKIAGGPTLPARQLAWAPRGESAAYTTKQGGVAIWTPTNGVRTILPGAWGAQAVAWDGDTLAIGRTVCHVPCGIPTHREVWTWHAGRLHRVLKLPNEAGIPMPFASDPRGRVLSWLWPDSGSIAADGVELFANAKPIAKMLMYADYAARCGRHLALAVGGDRNSMHGKSILLDGRDVSHDRTRSWVSPACSRDGSLLVATATNDNPDGPWGREHRALWQLLPTRKQLTHPPRGWTDEAPTVLDDGSILFVRTHVASYKRHGQWYGRTYGKLELLRQGTVTRVADVSDPAGTLMYYGHYNWPWRIAVRR